MRRRDTARGFREPEDESDAKGKGMGFGNVRVVSMMQEGFRVRRFGGFFFFLFFPFLCFLCLRFRSLASQTFRSVRFVHPLKVFMVRR